MSESHPYGEQQLVGYSDITVTVTKEEDTDKENRIEIAVSESQSCHGYWQLASYSNSESDRQCCNSKQQPILEEGFDVVIDLVLVSK